MSLVYTNEASQVRYLFLRNVYMPVTVQQSKASHHCLMERKWHRIGYEGWSIVGKFVLGEMIREGLFSLVREQVRTKWVRLPHCRDLLQWGVSAGSVTVVCIHIF